MSADIARARMLLEVGRAAEARELLARVLAADPSSFQALMLLGHACYVLDDHEAQLAAAEQLIRLGPEEEMGHRLRALACTRLNRHPEAIQDAREAVRLDPLDHRTHLVLSSVLRSVDHGPLRHAMLDEAWQAAMRAVDLAPERAETHLEAAIVALGQRKQFIAQQALNRALEIDPENAAAMNVLGVLRLKQHDSQAAAGHFRAALNADPGGSTMSDGLKGVARLLMLRVLVCTAGALGAMLVLMKFEHDDGAAALPVLRQVAGVLGLVAVLGALGWSLRGLDPTVRRWVAGSGLRQPSQAVRWAVTFAAVLPMVVLGFAPATFSVGAMVVAVLALAVALWVVLVL